MHPERLAPTISIVRKLIAATSLLRGTDETRPYDTVTMHAVGSQALSAPAH